mgnify:FL=1
MSISHAEKTMAIEIAQRYKLNLGDLWWLGDELLIKDINRLFSFDKKNHSSGHRRFDSIRMGAMYGAETSDLARKNEMSESDVERMIEIMRLGGRIMAADDTDWTNAELKLYDEA